jgi:hypothetical protein
LVTRSPPQVKKTHQIWELTVDIPEYLQRRTHSQDYRLRCNKFNCLVA